MDDFDRINNLNIDDRSDDDLPDLPTGRGDYAPDETEQDAYLHPQDMDLDEYLSYDEYEQQDEAEPEPQPRREAESPKKSGGLFGFLKKRGTPVQDVQEAAPVETDGYYPDSDPNTVDYPDEAGYSYEGGETAYDADRGQLYATHSGARGRAEREARDLIASLQAESGAEARDRRLAEDYRVDLEELLGIQNEEGEDIRPLPQAAKPEAEDEYHFDLDEALDIDADVKRYTGKHSAPAYIPDAKEPEIDERFNLGGQNTQKTMAYGDTEVDMSADEDYIPAQQTEYSPSQWTPDYDDPLAERQDTEEPPRKQHRGFFARRRRAEQLAQEAQAQEAEAPAADDAEELSDTAAGPAIYAVDAAYRDDPDYVMAPESIDNTDADADDDDFDDYDDEGSRKYRESELYAPPSFKEYLLSILASVWLKLRGTVRGRTAETMNDIEEDLGDELSPAEASKYYGSFLRSMKYRLRVSGFVLALLLYISLEMPVPGMMRSLEVSAAFCFGLQAVILLLALDVVTNGLMNALRLHFGADSLALVSCLFTGIDALIVALSETSAPHMPLCAISSAAVVGLLLSSYLSARGLRKATRVPAIGKHFFAVTAENTLEKDQITLLKSLRSVRGFVRRTEEAGPDETLYAKLSPILFVLALLLSLIVTVVKKSYPEFIYILSAQLVLTVPFGAMLSFSLPFFLGSTRIFKFGAAIAGWSGLCDIGASKNLIVTDRDLFPESAVSIDSVRIFADEDAQKVISYAGSMMQASGCCAAGCFGELMRETDSPARTIDGFEVMPGGGMKGVIEGHIVLCGSTDLMRLMNVRIPFRLTDKTTVLLAIDGILYGIFSLKYEGQPQIRRALSDLVRTAHPPVFAVRDFNVNPEMLHNTFDLATDGYDFPPYVERFRLSEPSEDVKDERITAILCNEGLAPLTSVADIGRSMYLATNINLVLNLLASVLGVALVFVRFLSTGANPLSHLFLYMAFCTLPVLLVSFFVSVKR
ncbi:MAG: hypothetical protein IJ649_02055 [Oscillospiraceae bacterium]|nr:hypothetical protein [Oscillospiraceae bacterium]